MYLWNCGIIHTSCQKSFGIQLQSYFSLKTLLGFLLDLQGLYQFVFPAQTTRFSPVTLIRAGLRAQAGQTVSPAALPSSQLIYKGGLFPNRAEGSPLKAKWHPRGVWGKSVLLHCVCDHREQGWLFISWLQMLPLISSWQSISLPAAG